MRGKKKAKKAKKKTLQNSFFAYPFKNSTKRKKLK
jgi:hypothetical protein